MSKILYVSKKFARSSMEVIDRSNLIIEEYREQGYDLTLRQLFYQHVSRDFLPNTQKSYSRLGDIINNARLAGLVDWDAIVDRTRNVRSNSHWDSPSEIVKSCAAQFQVDKWEDQDWHVECWIEKDALVGVIERVCSRLDVAYFSCRGYTSQSEMWSAAQRLVLQARAGKSVMVVHLGDHDPSGMDMSRDIGARLELFMGRYARKLKVNRIALNMPQVDRYQPPPNPAKLTDSRAKDYIAQFGDESWELDALDPPVMSRLIQDAVLNVRDDVRYEEAVNRERESRESLRAIADNFEEVSRYADDVAIGLIDTEEETDEDEEPDDE
jgi:hypothetical protein